MLKAAATKAFEVFLVDDLSQLTRDQIEGERAIPYP
jgi:hypothetical protein